MPGLIVIISCHMLTHHNSYYHLLQVELVLPKQVCRELLYGYVEKTVDTS